MNETLEQKDRIIEESMKLFTSSGIKNVTMDEIARQVGVSKKTLYVYFVDKQDLVYQMVEKELGKNCKKIDTISSSSHEIIRVFYEDLSEMKKTMSNINVLVFYDLQKYYPKAWKLYEDFVSDLCLVQFPKLLRAGVKEGYFREEIDIDVLCKLRLMELHIPFNQRAFSQSDYSASSVMAEISEHFVYGLCTPKGYEELKRVLNK